MNDPALHVEVVFALPQRVWRQDLRLVSGATVGDAAAASGLAGVCRRETGQPPAGYGIHGRNVSADEPLIDGNRVEIYRPLVVDPRDRRRRRGRTGSVNKP